MIRSSTAYLIARRNIKLIESSVIHRSLYTGNKNVISCCSEILNNDRGNIWIRHLSKLPEDGDDNDEMKEKEIANRPLPLPFKIESDDIIGKMGPSTTRPPSSSSSTGRLVGFKSTNNGGGNGGGRYRCPKCNTFVTFRPSSEFEVNTFYCSTCALWYMATGGGTVGSSNHLYQVKRSDARLDEQPPSKSKQSQELLTIVHNPTSEDTNKSFTMSNGGNDKRKGNMQSEYMEDMEHDESNDEDTQSTPTPLPTPLDICRGLNEYVIGQSNVKIALSVGVHNHYKRLTVAEEQAAANKQQFMVDTDGMNERSGTVLGDNVAGGLSDLNMSQYGRTNTSYPPSVPNKKSQEQDNEDSSGYCETPDINSIMNPDFGRNVNTCEIDKSNIIIIGPTGSGKTLLVKTLAKLIDVPLVVADATCLTQAGYVGEDVESILFKLYLESGQDLERCQRGIIYLDETDKIRKSGSNVSISRDVSGEGVQHALLKIVEGHVINVPKEPGRKNPRGDFLQIDTTNILFICGGAFASLERIINRRLDASSIGFGASMKKDLDNGNVTSKYFDSAIPKDLVDFGMIPEFIGRFPVIVSTKGLNVKNLVEILTVPKNSLLKQYEYLFAMNDVTLHVTQCGLEEIAKTAHKRGSGARGLRSITENVLMETMFVVPSLPDVHTVYLDACAVRGERKPILLKDPDMTVERYEYLKNKDENSDELFDGVEYVSLDDTFDEAVA